MKTVEDQLKQIRTANGSTFDEVQRKRTRMIAFVLTTTTIVSLIFLVFAFIQREVNDALREELQAVKAELAACQRGK